MHRSSGCRVASSFKLRPCVELMEHRIALSVSLEINSSATNTDDLTLYNPPSSSEPFVQMATLRVTNTGTAAATVTLTVSPPGAVTFTYRQEPLTAPLTLAPKAPAQVVITPARVSTKPRDITISAVGPGNQVEGTTKLTNVSVIVPGAVRNPDTPPTMTANRIPPRRVTKARVLVTPDLSGTGMTVSMDVTGNGTTANGRAEVQGTRKLAKTGDIELKGITQTHPTRDGGGGHAGNLKLAVLVHNGLTVESNGFSVAAIPENWTITLVRPIDGPIHGSPGRWLGFVEKDGWMSDSGDIEDLDEVHVREQVQVVSVRGVFAGATKAESADYLSAIGKSFDTHVAPFNRLIPDGGAKDVSQVHIFRDARTGSINIPITNSGYVIERNVFMINRNEWVIRTSERGARTSANGFISNAGAGGPISVTVPMAT